MIDQPSQELPTEHTLIPDISAYEMYPYKPCISEEILI